MQTPASTTMPDDYQAALAQGWLPIREVARQTGVNAVTLRAWERRYGLVVPQRTPKGHRLYSADHVQRIHAILTWLNRGVAVSQVKHLLDSREKLGNAHTQDDWQTLRSILLLAISELAESRLDDALNQAMALYPPRTLCERLLMPLLAETEQRWQGQLGARLEQVFFYSWLRSKLGARLYHNNRQVSGAPLLLINHSDRPLEPLLWLTAWLVSSVDCPVQVFDWPIPIGELGTAIDCLGAKGVLLYSSQAVDIAQLARQIAWLDCPKLLVGAAVRIHSASSSVSPSEIDGLHLAEDPLAAQQTLQRLGLL